MKYHQLYIFIFLVLVSCEPHYKHENGELPATPQNLSDFNTSLDDYNSTAPTLGSFIPLCFSTNRYSNGSQFDVIYEPMVVSFGKSTGEFRILNSYAGWDIYSDYNDIFHEGLKQLNTEGNELGPHFIVNNSFAVQEYEYLFLYASDNDGDFDIRFTFKPAQDTVFMPSLPIDVLNSGADDLYPFVDFKKGAVYFCSNRDENSFDIYSIELLDPNYNLLVDLQSINQNSIKKELILSSDFDDKCPYLLENKILFASNRPGGFGGYDLYYSSYKNGQWGTPQNMGESYNTEFDEYRPILIDEGVDDEKNIMIYSSNREGGKGGFDLYYVGVNKRD